MEKLKSLLNYEVKINGVSLLVIGLFLLYNAGYALGKYAFYMLNK